MPAPISPLMVAGLGAKTPNARNPIGSVGSAPQGQLRRSTGEPIIECRGTCKRIILFECGSSGPRATITRFIDCGLPRGGSIVREVMFQTSELRRSEMAYISNLFAPT